MAESEDAVEEIRRALDVVKSMIDILAERLEGLRTQCSTSAELTQQEIRTLEAKLIKLYSKQLVTKEKLAIESLPEEMRLYPSLQQWLRVVGLNPGSIEAVCCKATSLEALIEKSEPELSEMLGKNNEKHKEELRRLHRALHNLRRYMDVLAKDGMDNGDMNLYWDSWDTHRIKSGPSPRPYRTGHSRGSIPSEEHTLHQNNNNFQNMQLTSSYTSLLSASTPPNTPITFKNQGKFATHRPLSKKDQTENRLKSEAFSISMSKSHESQLSNRFDNGETTFSSNETPMNSSLSNYSVIKHNRLPTEVDTYGTYSVLSENVSSNNCSPIKSPPFSNTECDDNVHKATGTSLHVPKSPRTPTVTRGMGHIINHRFTKTFKMMTTCDYCDKQMFIGSGLKCKECKYKCHRDCESKVPPSCGLPQELVDEFKRTLQADNMTNASPVSSKSGIMSPSQYSLNFLVNLSRKDRKRSHPHAALNADLQKRRNASSSFQKQFWQNKHTSRYQGADSSSNTSSCNSSTPSSPALFVNASASQTPQTTAKQKFHFPDVKLNDKGVILETRKLEGTTVSSDSERTVSASGSGSVSTDSERTPIRIDSQDSQISDGEPSDGRWPRQNSLSMREWDIPYDELKIGEPIGKGRFGTIYRGNWHGDVAIRVLNMEHYLDDDDQTLEAFKLEVATFRKTRHENLILFMGACMKPRRLAIVTSLSKGLTLYTRIHLHKEKFTINNTTTIAQQISQGMGYLHARGIVHKDLRSKNIFLENGKVVITDFGLFSVTKLCYGNGTQNGINIPRGWLCYLSPEIVSQLKPQQNRNQEELPFTTASDAYAFGTVWYELLCGEWPFKNQPPESVIWQIGKGMKQSLNNLQASRDIKDILMLCWSYLPETRPDFAKLLTTLEKLPRKRLARSPSHPIHLSRSAESVF